MTKYCVKSLDLFAEIICPIDISQFKLLEDQGKYPRANWVSIDKRKPNPKLIKKNIVKIEDTPHYKLLSGDEIDYKEYMNKNKWTNYGIEHSYDNFKNLIKDFDISKVTITCKKKKKKLIITDGLHRMSIIKYNYQIYKDENIYLVIK